MHFFGCHGSSQPRVHQHPCPVSEANLAPTNTESSRIPLRGKLRQPARWEGTSCRTQVLRKNGFDTNVGSKLLPCAQVGRCPESTSRSAEQLAPRLQPLFKPGGTVARTPNENQILRRVQLTKTEGPGSPTKSGPETPRFHQAGGFHSRAARAPASPQPGSQGGTKNSARTDNICQMQRSPKDSAVYSR